MNIALIGLGRHGMRYASHLLAGDVPGARLAVVHRRDLDAGRRFASESGTRFVPDATEAATDEGVQAVVLCVPPDINRKLAIAALAAGKAVLVEKPMAADLAGAIAIERAARRGTLMVAQTLRFNSVVRAMEAARDSLGPIHGFSASQRYEPLPIEWIDDPDRGGTLRVTGVHAFDLLRFLTGAEVTRVSCETIPAAPEADRSFAALLHLEPGPVLACIDNSRLSSGRCGRMEIVGENGSLVGDHVLGELHRLQGGVSTPLPVHPAVPTVRQCLRAFVAASRGEMRVPITAEDGRRAVEITDACRKAALTGRQVKLGRG